MKQFIAGPNDAGVRLSRFVLRVTKALPEASLHRHFRNRRIKVNGKRAAADYRLVAGDVIELYLNDEFFPLISTQTAVTPDTRTTLPDFSVVWEDKRLAVLYKPAGVLSHPEKNGPPSLLDAFTQFLLRKGDYNPEAENQFAPALCNRLDRGTEGLLVAAKQYAALRDMNALIRAGLLEKNYLCVTQSVPPEGTHTAWLLRDRGSHRVAVYGAARPGAKEITTGVKVLEQAGGLALCQVRLNSGRTHQIRAHLAFLGAPLAGDRKYGNRELAHALRLPSQALCAWRLALETQLPKENTLRDLAGRVFEANQAALPAWWKAWVAEHR